MPRAALAQAVEHRDEDYRALFDADVLNYSAPDYPWQIERLGEGLRWAKQHDLPEDFFLLRSLGVYHGRNDDQDAAIAWFEKALAENADDSAAYWHWSVAEWKRGNRSEALEQIRKAVRLDPEHWGSDFRALYKLAGLDADAEWVKLFPQEMPEERGPEENLQDLPAFIGYVQKAFRDRAEEYLASQKENEKARQRFLQRQSFLDPDRSVLMVLRRWNSYTPALPAAEEERSIGGGYFLWHNGHGTVIDPGYNFLEDFYQAGCRLCDVDNVILTHAHNDHTIEFESLRTLLHEFNDKAPDEHGETKRVRFFLNNGALKKFAGMIDFKDTDFTDRVQTMNPGGRFELLGGGKLLVLPAYHDEVLARDQAVGLLLTLATPADEQTEVWRRYLADGGERPHVMVVHIGAVKRQELDAATAREPAKACYANHLGLIGTARAVAMCRPNLAVVSEFGEEMKNLRTELVRTLHRDILEPLLRDDDFGPVPRTVPGDLDRENRRGMYFRRDGD